MVGCGWQGPANQTRLSELSPISRIPLISKIRIRILVRDCRKSIQPGLHVSFLGWLIDRGNCRCAVGFSLQFVVSCSMVEKDRKALKSDTDDHPLFDTVFNDWEFDPELSPQRKDLEGSFEATVCQSQDQMFHLFSINCLHRVPEHLHGCGGFAIFQTCLFKGTGCSIDDSISNANIVSDGEVASGPQAQQRVAAFVMTIPCVSFRTFLQKNFAVFGRQWDIIARPQWIGFNHDCIAGHRSSERPFPLNAGMVLHNEGWQGSCAFVEWPACDWFVQPLTTEFRSRKCVTIGDWRWQGPE